MTHAGVCDHSGRNQTCVILACTDRPTWNEWIPPPYPNMFAGHLFLSYYYSCNQPIRYDPHTPLNPLGRLSQDACARVPGLQLSALGSRSECHNAQHTHRT